MLRSWRAGKDQERREMDRLMREYDHSAEELEREKARERAGQIEPWKAHPMVLGWVVFWLLVAWAAIAF